MLCFGAVFPPAHTSAPQMAERKVEHAYRAYTENDVSDLKLAVSRGTLNFSRRIL